MASQKSNPFVLPGFGQTGDMAQNPLLASMEMMRSAWEGLSKAGGLDEALTASTSPEQLERRIADLRAVEHWLRMNLSMLASTIQALEVQRATMATLNSFLSSTSGGQHPSSPSPLEAVLGIKAGSGAAQSNPFAAAALSSTAAPAPTADSSGLFGDPLTSKSSSTPSQEKQDPAPIDIVTSTAETAMQGWWDMLQTQFDTIAEATAATLKSAENLKETAVAKAADKPITVKKEKAKKPVAKKEPTKKAAVKKATAKKSAVKKAAVNKVSDQKAVTKKTATKASAKATKATKETNVASKPAVKKATAKKAVTKTVASSESNK